MEWLNYHHLLYFYTVARLGGLAPAARELRLAHPTLSTQIHALEARLGEKLFTKQGRKLALTESGRLAYRYADEIFGLGRELVDVVQGRHGPDFTLRLEVGVVDAVPKMAVRRILEPALRLAQPVRLVCREGRFDTLLGVLAAGEIHVLIADAPVPAGSPVRAFSHPLGESGVSLLATPGLAATLKPGFPQSLEGAPMLMPAAGLPVRRALDEWFGRARVRPAVVAEFEDSALLKAFGADGVGVFHAPTAVEDEVREQTGTALVGRIPEVRERYYVITVERRIEHPAVAAITAVARSDLFAGVTGGREKRTGPGKYRSPSNRKGRDA
jgi:LysR family transcriptional activator of nhaA